MRCLLFMALGAMCFVVGCQEYAKVEDLRIGMRKEEVLQKEMPCMYRGEAANVSSYSCKLDVPWGNKLENRKVKPFILIFENDQLKSIELDERRLDREAVKYQYDTGFYYWHGGDVIHSGRYRHYW